MLFSGTHVGIDLGTATVLIYVKDRGIVLHEPSLVVLETETNEVIAIGDQAVHMLGRTPTGVQAVRPLRDGVISDYEVTQMMLQHFMVKAIGRRLFNKPSVMVCVPSGVTDVERRAVVEAARAVGGRDVQIKEEPVAAAIGAGLDIFQPRGCMVVDIGGGTSDIAVLSMGELVVAQSIKVAGNKMDEAIIRYMKQKHNLLIGDRTAEQVKINIGSVYEMATPLYMDVMGRNLLTGLPKSVTISSGNVREALTESTTAILDGVHKVLERTPPELAADIYESGIVLTGGGAQLLGLDRLISTAMEIPCRLADDPVSCVAVGTGKCIEYYTRKRK